MSPVQQQPARRFIIPAPLRQPFLNVIDAAAFMTVSLFTTDIFSKNALKTCRNKS